VVDPATAGLKEGKKPRESVAFLPNPGFRPLSSRPGCQNPVGSSEQNVRYRRTHYGGHYLIYGHCAENAPVRLRASCSHRFAAGQIHPVCEPVDGSAEAYEKDGPQGRGYRTDGGIRFPMNRVPKDYFSVISRMSFVPTISRISRRFTCIACC